MVNYNFARFFRGGNVGLGDGVYTPLTTTRAPAVLKFERLGGGSSVFFIKFKKVGRPNIANVHGKRKPKHLSAVIDSAHRLSGLGEVTRSGTFWGALGAWGGGKGTNWRDASHFQGDPLTSNVSRSSVLSAGRDPRVIQPH